MRRGSRAGRVEGVRGVPVALQLPLWGVEKSGPFAIRFKRSRQGRARPERRPAKKEPPREIGRGRGLLRSVASVTDYEIGLFPRSAVGAAVRDPRRAASFARVVVVCTDLAALSLAAAVATSASGATLGRGSLLPLIAFGTVWLLAALVFGLYDRKSRLDRSALDELGTILHVTTLTVWLVCLGAAQFGASSFGVVELATFGLVGVPTIALGRSGANAFLRREGAGSQRVVIVGAGDIGQLLGRKLLQHPERGVELVGFVDTAPKERRRELREVPSLGGFDELVTAASCNQVDRVVIAFSNESVQDLIELVRSLRKFDVQVDLVPRLFDVVGPEAALDSVQGISLLSLGRVRLSPASRAVKRGMDLAIAGVALVLVAPVFAVIAYAIKRDSPGPVFFRQTRLGIDRREFTLFKFRTMSALTDDAAHRDYIGTIADRLSEAGLDGLYKLERDDAVTRVGRWLRRTSLDELPQLVNVLRGDMSIVGPRPCLPYELEFFAPHHFERFTVPAGLTGLWQVRARACSSFGEALDMDVAYATAPSLRLDLSLILQTPFQLFRGNTTH